jgi:hypothetical protein
LLNKTPYELLIGIKYNIAYFRVFGCKYHILNKSTRLSKFEKKYDKGPHLDTPQLAKHIIYNKTHGIVEEVHNVEFDETNGSQVENENLDDVRFANIDEKMK